MFGKYTIIWEKSWQYNKKFNWKLKCNKKYLKAQKRFNTKGGFQFFIY